MKRVLGILAIVLVWSCDDIVGVEDISDNTVSILAPTEGAVLTTTSPSFSWEDLDGAVNYNLQIATPSFETATQIVADTTLTANSYTHVLSSGDYEWRIRGENSEYETVYTTQSFTIED